MSLARFNIHYFNPFVPVIPICVIVLFAGLTYADDSAKTGTVSVTAERLQNKKSFTKPVTTPKERKAATGIGPNREKLALEFAKQHHPELAKLIQRLKKHKPREYKRALRDLDNTRTKLERFKNRDTERYRLTLERWEVDSRIRLLAARVSVMGSATDKSKLKNLITKRVDLQLELLRYDQKQAEKRVEKLQKSISEIVENRDDYIDAEFKKINRSIKKTGQKNKNKK
ncbi:hypothetical protein [Gimesia aquarii]|uniref:Uncharacterized protein n=1 Tax=Gimesia aquarii TaxID=2527964 RepID=A0A517X0X1_9PLAN|nr:hypothetical protein [Gimesia aquarii]QDU11155.1 hypothetical protein V202x_45710 [Gimesia aquarii]